MMKSAVKIPWNDSILFVQQRPDVAFTLYWHIIYKHILHMNWRLKRMLEYKLQSGEEDVIKSPRMYADTGDGEAVQDPHSLICLSALRMKTSWIKFCQLWWQENEPGGPGIIFD